MNDLYSLTSSQKLGQIKNRGFGAIIKFNTFEYCHEKIKIHGGADCICAQAIGDGSLCRRGVPEIGHQRADVLQLEEEVWRFGCDRAGTPPGVGEREFTFEEACC